jgi:hypothetical protein
MVGDVLVYNKTSLVTSSISRLPVQLSSSEVLIGIECVCIYKGERPLVYVSVCVGN